MDQETIETVSPDILKLISKKLDTTSVAKWCITSKRFKKIICDSDSTWIDRIKKDDGVDITKLKKNYINRYVKLHQIGDEILDLSKELLLTEEFLTDEYEASKRKAPKKRGAPKRRRPKTNKLGQEISAPKDVIVYFKNFNDENITRVSKKVVLNTKIMILLAEYLKLATRAQYFYVSGEIVDYRDIQFKVIIRKKGLRDYNIRVKFNGRHQLVVGFEPMGVYLSDIFKILDYISEQNETKGLFYDLMFQINEIKNSRTPIYFD